MIGIGVFLVWAAYGLGVWGVSLVKGWNLGFRDIWSPTGYYTGKWPPGLAGNTVIIPDGSKAATLSADFETDASAGAAAGGSAPAAPAGVTTNAAAIQKAAALFGWGSGDQFGCVQWIVGAESGGNSLIANPSGAFGIGQALGHGQECSAASGVTYTVSGGGGQRTGTVNEYGPQYGLSCAQAKQANAGNAWYQALWMMGYIKARYGTPCKAKAFHQANGYY